MKRRVMILLLVALGIAAGLVWVSGAIENRYLRHNAFFFDPVAYLNEYRELGQAVEAEGRLSVAWEEVRSGVMPGWTLPLVLLAPERLEGQTGHLLAALPMLVAGLLAIGWWVMWRWGSLGAGMAAMLLGAMVPGYFDPMYGLGAFWLDHAAGFPAVAAIVLALVWMQRGGWGWLVGFAALALWTVSCRYVAAAYLLVIGGPIFGMGLIRLWREAGWKRAVCEIGVLVVAMAVLVMPFMLSRLEGRMAHYDANSFGYQGVWDSLVYAYACFAEYAAAGWLLLTVAVMVGLAWFGHPAPLRHWWLPFWLANGMLLFLGFSTQIGEAGQSTFFNVPFWVLAVFAVPVADRLGAVSRLMAIGRGSLRFSTTMPALAMVGALWIGGVSVGTAWKSTARTDPDQFDRTMLYRRLLWELNALPEATAVALLYENTELEGPRLRAEMRHRLDRELQLPRSTYLYHLEGLWAREFPGQTPEQVAAVFETRLLDQIDLAVAYADPSQATETRFTDFHSFRNPYSEQVAMGLAEYLRHSPDWEPLFELESAAYGSLIGYRNLRRASELD